MHPNNTWGQKLKRTLTSVLPVDERRRGQCKRCGACCSLPNRCPFLRFEDVVNRKNSFCSAYKIRPLNCRKYPRILGEQVVRTCGYYFKDEE